MNTEIAILGGGCFWCTEAIFRLLRGVLIIEPGYAGGHVPHPTYAQVCTGTTGHAEVVRIIFDPDTISYHEILTVFFATHDPTTLNRQGNDVGEQYRSVVFATTPAQAEIATSYIAELNSSGGYTATLVTTVETLHDYYPAEDYHKEYFALHGDEPYCALIIAPKIAKLHERFSHILQTHTT